MAQNIGTNVAIDENDLYPFYESILDQIERIQDNHGLSKDRQNLKALLDHVGAGHKLVQNQFYGNEAAQIKEELDKRNIPYIMLPSKLGGDPIETIIVKDSDTEIFTNIQGLVQRQNGRLYMELDADTMIHDIKTEATFKGMRTPVFEFKDSAKRALFLKELSKNNVPYGFDSKTNKIIVYPTSAYRKNDLDLSSAILDMSVKYAMFDRHPAYAKYSELIAKGNNETLQDFIDRYMGNHGNGKIENLSEKKRLDIVGESIIYTDLTGDEPYVKKLTIPEGITKDELFVYLSTYTEEIIRTEDNPILTADASDTRAVEELTVEQLKEMDNNGRLTPGQKVFLAKRDYIGNEKNPYRLEGVEDALREEASLRTKLYKAKLDAGKNIVESDSPDRKCQAELNYIGNFLKQDSCGIKKDDARLIAENLDASIKNGSGAFGWNYVEANKLEAELGRDGGTFDKDYNSERNIDIERDPVEVEIEAADE